MNKDFDDEVDLGVLWNTIWKYKILITVISAVFSAIAIVISLMIPNEYRSEVLLAPVSDAKSGGALAGLVGSFGGLASMAGISLGGDDKTTLAIETVKSRKFIFNFIKKNKLLVPLLASESWNPSSDKLLLDNSLYDEARTEWIRDVSLPKTTIPSDIEAYEEFLEHFSINKNQDTGYISMSFEFYSPFLAKQWLEDLVSELNQQLREQDIVESKRIVVFLEKQLEMTTVSEMKKMFYELIEEQTKKIMLANVRDEYVLKTIDPAIVAIEKSKPKRALIVIFSGFLGGLLGMLFALSRRTHSSNPV